MGSSLSTEKCGQGNLTEGESLGHTVDLPVLTNLDQLIFYSKYCLTLLKSYLYEEVKCTDPSPSVSVPWCETLASGDMAANQN